MPKELKCILLWSLHRGEMDPSNSESGLDIKIDDATNSTKEYKKAYYSYNEVFLGKNIMGSQSSRIAQNKSEQRLSSAFVW